MYIIINKETQKATICGEKTIVADLLKCHRHTILKRFKENHVWEREKEIVYYTDDVRISNKKGNKDSYKVKIAKARGEIECNK